MGLTTSFLSKANNFIRLMHGRDQLTIIISRNRSCQNHRRVWSSLNFIQISSLTLVLGSQKLQPSINYACYLAPALSSSITQQSTEFHPFVMFNVTYFAERLPIELFTYMAMLTVGNLCRHRQNLQVRRGSLVLR